MADNVEQQIQQEVQRRVGSQMRQANDRIAELTNNVQELRTKLVERHEKLKRLLGEPLTFGTLLKVHNQVDPKSFKSNDTVHIIDPDSPYYHQSGRVISGFSQTPVVDEDGKVLVELSNQEEIRFSIGMEGKDPAQVRLAEKDDGTFAVVSIDGKPWEVRGVPDLGLVEGDPVKVRLENKAIVCRGYNFTAGPVCLVSAITDNGVEVQHKGDRIMVFNPHHFDLEEGDRVACDHGMFCIIQKLERDPRERYKLKTDLTVTWADIGGLETAKAEMQDALELPFKQPKLFAHYGVQPIRGILLYGAPGCGKAQPLSSMVWTPTGTIQMGNIKVGQEVCVPDGGAAKVIGVFPQGKKDIYRVTFSDGSSTRCCDEHLWNVETRNNYRSGVMDTKFLRSKLKMNDGKRIYSIPMTKPVLFKERVHQIHPYLMGALLAEGHFGGSVSITVCNVEMFARLCSVLPEGYSLKSKDDPERPCDYYLTRDKNEDRSWLVDPILTDEIRRLGLSHKLADNKFIPSEYLVDSLENRLELIRGLMDGDGTVTKNGMGCSLSTASPELARDFRLLIQSLGGICNICEKETTYTYKGQKLKGKLSHRCFVSINNMSQLFSVGYKLGRIKEKTKRFTKRLIESIELIGREQAQCILIDHPEHLYLTDEFIVTHNTLLARASAAAIAGIHGKEAVESAYIYVKSPEILNKWVGNTEAEIRELFERGRRHYREHGYKGILAFDEADAIMPQRGSRRSSDVADTIVPMFLGEMDGIDEQQTKENPIVILMTNRADILDPAVTRPGRISKHIKIDRPNEFTAIDILQIHTKSMPFAESNKDMLLNVAVSDLFSKSRLLYRINNEHDFTLGDSVNGAMLAALAESTKMNALHRDLENGTQTGVVVEDFRQAVKKMYNDQRGLNHQFDITDFCERMGLQNNVQIERCFGAV